MKFTNFGKNHKEECSKPEIVHLSKLTGEIKVTFKKMYIQEIFLWYDYHAMLI